MRFIACSTLMLVSVLLGCSDDPVAPATGSVEVTVATTGAGTDADGYIVALDDDAETEEVETDDVVTFADVDTGAHSVELTGLAANCTVDGDNPQAVTVAADETAEVTFDVTCTAA